MKADADGSARRKRAKSFMTIFVGRAAQRVLCLGALLLLLLLLLCGAVADVYLAA